MSNTASRAMNEVAAVGETLLGKYRVERVLGQGGMGVVLAARHIELDELFALKLLGADVVSNTSTVSRFLREARAAARLTSEHVARVHDVGRLDNGTPYMVMEYLKGSDLANVVDDHGPFQVEAAAELMLQACDAVAEAHALGIVHRDIKLSNLFLTRRRSGKPCLKVLDFGISKQADVAEQLTRPGTLMGSPLYMSPEQIENPKAVDARTDIWAMGVVLCQLTTGATPFRGESLQQLIFNILDTDPDLPSRSRPELPPELDQVVARCLRKRPDDRYATIDELAAAVQRLAARPHAATPSTLAPDSLQAPCSARSALEPPRSVQVHSVSAARHVGLGVDPAMPGEPTLAADTRLPLDLPNGIVSAESPYYVVRPAVEDACLREVLQRGALVRIKGPRQMGKTSLMMRILGHADKAGARTVTINLQMADSAILADLDRFLRWLCAVVSRRLAKRRVDDVWDDIFGAKDNCTAYFEEHVLTDVDTLVLALDNVDRVFDYPGTAEEFLSILRAWHEMGKSQRAWHALRLVLAYSTEMYVPMNTNRSPFNVGLPVALGEWDADQVHGLAMRHGVTLSRGDVDLLMSLLGGHPHLVRIALYHLGSGKSLSDVLATADTDEGLFADHLKHLLWQLQRQPELRDAARQVFDASGPIRLSTELAFKLVSLGLVRLQGNEVRAHREVYRQYLSARLAPTCG